jgi:hypothetical protein
MTRKDGIRTFQTYNVEMRFQEAGQASELHVVNCGV